MDKVDPPTITANPQPNGSDHLGRFQIANKDISAPMSSSGPPNGPITFEPRPYQPLLSLAENRARNEYLIWLPMYAVTLAPLLITSWNWPSLPRMLLSARVVSGS